MVAIMSKKEPFIYILGTLILVILLMFAVIAMVLLLKDEEQTTMPSFSIGNGLRPSGTNMAVDSPYPADYSIAPSGEDYELDKDKILCAVYADTTTNLYLRSRSYGDYTGQSWEEAPVYPKLINGTYSATYLSSFYLEKSGADTHHVQIEPYTANYILPYHLSTDSKEAPIQTSDTVFTGDTTCQYAADFYLWDDRALSYDGGNDRFEQNYRNYVYDNYLNIDPQTLSYMQTIIDREGFSSSDADIIDRVAEYIQGSASYNLHFDPALEESDNIAIAFLEEYQEGVCRHFATAATLLYRSLGIPARFTVGVLAETRENEWVEVNALQAHAWVEVYQNGIGWINVEVTNSTPNGPIRGEEPAEKEKIELLLTPTTVQKLYDGTPLYPDGQVTGLEEYTAQGYTYVAQVTGEGLEIGVTPSYLHKITIYDPQGNDVTGDFSIAAKPGMIYIYQTLILKSNSFIKEYDGQPVQPQVEVVEGQLREGDTLIPSPTISTEVGIYAHDFDFTIVDRAGNDVTQLYQVRKALGEARICYDTLTIESRSQNSETTYEYDGRPIEADFFLLDGDLRPGDHWQATLAIVEKPGNHALKFQTTILDAEGNDVTQLYIIKVQEGMVTIDCRNLTVRVINLMKRFDGAPLVGEYEGCDGLLVGHEIDPNSIVYSSSGQTEIGQTDYQITSLIIRDGEGNDVTEFYAINFETGTLTVTP